MAVYLIKKHPVIDLLIGDDGKVYSLDGTERIQQDYGYMRIMVKRRTYAVHRLVAETFIPNPDNKTVVDHIDKDRKNNVINNLRWVTPQENAQSISHDNSNKKSVDLYTVYGDYVATLGSIQEAADILGVVRNGITVNLKRKGWTNGYYVIEHGGTLDGYKIFPHPSKITGC